MHSIRLVSAILKGKWYIDPDFALAQGPVVAGLLNNQTALFPITSDTEDLPFIAASKPTAEDGKIYGVRYSWRNGFDMAPVGSVAVIDINGPLMKEDQDCGPDGTATIGRIIKQADNHPNILAIVLNVDSPGGTVDGTEALAAIVKSTGKPVVTFVDGLMASAALWIGTSAREVIASTDTDEVGSVGVILNFADMRPAYEKQGVVFHTVVASTSPDKQKTYNDLRAGKYDEIIKEQLDVLDEKFMAAVRENRPQVEDRHLTGKVFFARDVMGVFVDSIGTIETAILRAAYMAENPEDFKSENFKNNSRSMKQFTRLNTVLGVESLESVDESVSLNADQLEMVDTALGVAETVTAERDTALEQVTTLATERDTAHELVTTVTGERDAAVAAQTTAEEQVISLTAERDAALAAIAEFDAIDHAVSAAPTAAEKATAIRTLLSSKPGLTPVNPVNNENNDQTDQFASFTDEEKELIENLK
jgi:protease-4